MSPRQRIHLIADEGSFQELLPAVTGVDPLSFPGYEKKLQAARLGSHEEEGVVCGVCTIGGHLTCLFVMDPFFMMGSMGSAVGEKITLLFEYAKEYHLPVVGYTVSGGARMQEGIISLMQMAKTSGAVQAPQRCRGTVYRRPYRPHYRGRYCQLCHGGGHHPGRTGGPHRLCRASGH